MPGSCSEPGMALRTFRGCLRYGQTRELAVVTAR
jgi:hypothetical protein